MTFNNEATRQQPTMTTPSTINDAAIAAALEHEEQERIAEEISSQHTNPFQYPAERRNIFPGDNGDRSVLQQPPTTNDYPGANNDHNNNRNSSFQDNPPPRHQFPSFSFPPFVVVPQQQHMCSVPAVISNICIEMDIDSGAQTSVMSLSLAKRLRLETRIDRRLQGTARGVGQAKIVGRITNVICVLHNVEFAMDFHVLDINDDLLLLGLDLMRKYKCIIDLESEKIIFGGVGGVDVDFLPPNKTSRHGRPPESCIVM